MPISSNVRIMCVPLFFCLLFTSELGLSQRTSEKHAVDGSSQLTRHRGGCSNTENYSMATSYGHAHLILAKYGEQDTTSVTVVPAAPLVYLGIPGGESTVLYANNAGTGAEAPKGNYTWSITSGADKVSFSDNSTVPTTTSTNSFVTIYSSGGSNTFNDITIQVTGTSCDVSLSGQGSFSVNSPYQLSPPSNIMYFAWTQNGDSLDVQDSTHNWLYVTQHGYFIQDRLSGATFTTPVWAIESLFNAQFAPGITSNWDIQSQTPLSGFTSSGYFTDSNGFNFIDPSTISLSPLPVPFGTVETYTVYTLDQEACISVSNQQLSYGQQSCNSGPDGPNGLLVQTDTILENVDQAIISCVAYPQTGNTITCPN